MGKVVVAEGITHSYPQRGTVLEDVSLAVEEGEFYGIIGPNGGGKTTLLRILLGLVKPDRGRVILRGKAGYVPQNLSVEPFCPQTVKDLVTAVGGRSSHDVLAQLHLHEFWNRRFVDLSGGQKKIALLAMALSTSPHLLLLDEPTSELDVHFRKHVLNLLRELAERGTAVILVSHDINFVLTNASRVLVLSGRVIFEGSPSKAGEVIPRVFGMGVLQG